MATEIGTAYLSIVASTGGMTKDIKKAFGQVETEGEKSGKASGGGFIRGLGGKIIAAGAVLGVGAAVGKTISLGMQRAMSIEGSQKKLEGLGHSAQSITSIMGSALSSVKGTAYGLGDAASVAAMMAAAGVKNGEQMTTTLKTVADVAAISGRSLTDIGTIFGSVAARGKLQGDDMLQLMSSGVPVLQLLAKQTGKTSAEVSDMVSKGKIDFATFEAAMRQGMGGAALKSGETFSGAVANMQAALGRLGAAFMAPGLAAAKPLLAGLTAVLDSVTSAVAPAAEALASKMVPAAERIGAVLQGLAAGKPLGELLGDAAPVTSLVSAVSPLGVALRALQPVLPQLAQAFLQVVQALLPAVPAIAQVASTIASGLAVALGQIIPIITPIVVKLAELAGALLSNEPVLYAIIGAFAGFKVISGVATTVGTLTSAFSAAQGVLGAFSAGLRLIPWVGEAGKAAGFALQLGQGIGRVLPIVTGALKGLWAVMLANPIGVVIGIIAALVAGLVWFFTQTEVGRQIWADFTNWLAGVWSTIQANWTSSFASLGQLMSSLWTGLTAGATAAWNGVVTGAQWAASGLQALWGVVTAQASAAWSGLVAIVQAIWGTVAPILTAPIQGFVAVMSAVFESIKAVVAAGFLVIVGLFTGNGTMIVQAMGGLGSTLQGIWSGAFARLASIAAAAGSALLGILSHAWSALSGAATAAWGAVSSAFLSGVGRAAAFAAQLPGRAASALAALGGLILGIASRAWASLVSAFAAGVSNAIVHARALPGRVSAALAALGGLILGIASRAWSSLVSAFAAGVSQAISEARALPGRAAAALAGTGNALRSAGANLIRGFLGGIENMASQVAAKAREVVGGAVRAAQNALGIRSPSRVFMLIGNQTGQGLVIGLDRMVGPVAASAADMVAAAIPDGGLIGKATGAALNDLSGQVSMTVQAKYDALAVRLPRPSDAPTPAPSDRMEVLLEQLIAEVRAGREIYLDGDKLVGGTTRRTSESLSASQHGASRANGQAGLVVV